MAANYYWNIALCEALYQNLGALETAFRNTLSTSLEIQFGRPDWYDEPGLLLRREAMDVFGAKFDVQAAGKHVTPGQIVARQSFGFWTSLISQGYKVWAQNNHAAIIRAFPNAPVHMRYRKRIFDHMNAIRALRNRVFHYESVLDGVTQGGTRLPLARLHADIVDAIEWIDRDFHASVQAFDEFPIIHSAGPSVNEARIKAHLGIP